MEKQLQNMGDTYRWALETAAAVRAGKWDAIDKASLLDELEGSIAGGLVSELHISIRDILRARLSLKLAPRSDRKRNKNLLENAFRNTHEMLVDCPSLKGALTKELVEEAYKDAKYIIGRDLSLPKRCPYSPEQLLKEAEAFNYDAL